MLEKLLSADEFRETVTGVWGFFSGSAAKMVESTKTLSATLAEKAKEIAHMVVPGGPGGGSWRGAAAGGGARGAGAAAPSTTTPVKLPLPWDTVPSELRTEAKTRILGLSSEDKTFLVPPPATMATTTASATTTTTTTVALEDRARRMLEVDPLLSAKRFKLVPKSVEEDQFWRNYFYRVDMILESLAGSGAATAAASPAPVATPSSGAAAAALKQDNSKGTATPSKPSKATPSSPGRPGSASAAAAAATTTSTTSTTTTPPPNLVVEDENFDMLDADDLEFGDDDEELGEEIAKEVGKA